MFFLEKISNSTKNLVSLFFSRRSTCRSFRVSEVWKVTPPSSYLHYGNTHRRSWMPSLFLVQHFHSSTCFPSMVCFLLFLLNLIVEIGPRGNKTKQTENHVGCQASLSASLSQWLAPGKPEGTWVLWLLPCHDAANIGLASGWWTSGKYWPHDCMVLTQPPVELEAKSEEGSSDLISEGPSGGAAAFPSLKWRTLSEPVFGGTGCPEVLIFSL